MIRVVLDTNIIVSALLQPLALESSTQLCISGRVYAEYEQVIRRPRLRLDEDTITQGLHAIREKSLWVRPTEAIEACADPDDDIFLECAQAARAGENIVFRRRPRWCRRG